MDLIRIFHMVNTPSSGKCDFNHIYAVGLILFILIHFESVLCESVQFILIFFLFIMYTQCPYFGMVLACCAKGVGFCCYVLTGCFLRTKVQCSHFGIILVYCSLNDGLASVVLFLLYVLFPVFSQIQDVVLFSVDMCGFSPAFDGRG